MRQWRPCGSPELILRTLCRYIFMSVMVHAITAEAATRKNHSSSDWYSRYPFYPPYCSTPEQMAQRAIPPLQSDSTLRESQLIHVTAVIRHGSRTPLASHECWDGFWERADTGLWNCDLTTVEAPHHHHHLQQQPMLLVAKRYDALRFPQSNLLNGTCQVGQLLRKGYEQGLELGRQLRRAYLYDHDDDNGSNVDHDNDPRRMKLLFRLDCADDSNLHLRSDDNPRTIMTAQALQVGMMLGKQRRGGNPLVSIHTADKSRDIISKNTKLCPRLEQLKKEGEASRDYQAYHASSEAKVLRTFMKEKLGHVLSNPSDCLMTTICNDRTLPDAVNDYQGEEGRNNNTGTADLDHENWFRRLVDMRTKLTTLYIQHNHAAFAKLATGPLWNEIQNQILSAIEESNSTFSASSWSSSSSSCPAAHVNQMAVFSAHDGTIMNLMSSLGPNVWGPLEWPPYASLMVLEIHNIAKKRQSHTPPSFAFRLLYNGQVRTAAMNKCLPGEELCDLKVLLDQIMPFATRSRNCKEKEATIVKSSVLLQPSSFSGPLALFLIMLIGACLGSALAYILYCRVVYTNSALVSLSLWK